MNLSETTNTAVDIAREAGILLRDGFHQAKQIDAKSSAIDLVTQYDTRAETLIVQRLRDAFPHDAILGEEGGQQTTGDHLDARIWIVDPLDGTINFAHGFPVFAVSIALYDGDTPLAGVVYDPMRDECFYATRGHGAFLATARDAPQPLRVSQSDHLVRSLLATGFPYDRHDSALNNIAQFSAFLKRAQGIRRAGAAALDVAYVAAGRLDGFWEFKLGSWDVAAAILLLLEAGGKATDIDGSPFHLQPTAHNNLIASNGLIHDEMVSLLQAVPSDA